MKHCEVSQNKIPNIPVKVMNETTSSEPRIIATYCGPNCGCHLKTKLATSVSTTSFAVAVGIELTMALLIDQAHELFRFFRGSWINMT